MVDRLCWIESANNMAVEACGYWRAEWTGSQSKACIFVLQHAPLVTYFFCSETPPCDDPFTRVIRRLGQHPSLPKAHQLPLHPQHMNLWGLCISNCVSRGSGLPSLHPLPFLPLFRLAALASCVFFFFSEIDSCFVVA